MSTSVDERTSVSQTIETDVTPQLNEPGDHDLFSHYVSTSRWVEGYMGEEVTSMCGKTWIPSKDPKKYPVCPECKEIFETLPPGGEGDQ